METLIDKIDLCKDLLVGLDIDATNEDIVLAGVDILKLILFAIPCDKSFKSELRELGMSDGEIKYNIKRRNEDAELIKKGFTGFIGYGDRTETFLKTNYFDKGD